VGSASSPPSRAAHSSPLSAAAPESAAEHNLDEHSDDEADLVGGDNGSLEDYLSFTTPGGFSAEFEPMALATDHSPSSPSAEPAASDEEDFSYASVNFIQILPDTEEDAASPSSMRKAAFHDRPMIGTSGRPAVLPVEDNDSDSDTSTEEEVYRPSRHASVNLIQVRPHAVGPPVPVAASTPKHKARRFHEKPMIGTCSRPLERMEHQRLPGLDRYKIPGRPLPGWDRYKVRRGLEFTPESDVDVNQQWRSQSVRQSSAAAPSAEHGVVTKHSAPRQDVSSPPEVDTRSHSPPPPAADISSDGAEWRAPSASLPRVMKIRVVYPPPPRVEVSDGVEISNDGEEDTESDAGPTVILESASTLGLRRRFAPESAGVVRSRAETAPLPQGGGEFNGIILLLLMVAFVLYLLVAFVLYVWNLWFGGSSA